MNRGIVMEISKRHLVVLTAEGSFYRLPVKPDASIGEEILFPADARRGIPRRLLRLTTLAAVVLLLLFVPFLVLPFKEQSAVAAYLTMDINPSLELGINKNEHVVQLRALNQTGISLIKDLAFHDLPLEQVTRSIMERVQNQHYLPTDGGEIVITSIMMRQVDDVSYERQLSQQMDTAIKKVLEETAAASANHVEVTTLAAPKELRDEANEQGISAGKMAVYLLAKSQGHEVSVEELKTHSIPHTTKNWGGVKAVVDGKDKVSPDQQNQLKKKLQELIKSEKEEQAKTKKAPEGQRQKGKSQENKAKNPQKDVPSSSKDKDKQHQGGADQSRQDKASGQKAGTGKTVPGQNTSTDTDLGKNGSDSKEKKPSSDKWKLEMKQKQEKNKKQDKNNGQHNSNNENNNSRNDNSNGSDDTDSNDDKDKDKVKDKDKDKDKDKEIDKEKDKGIDKEKDKEKDNGNSRKEQNKNRNNLKNKVKDHNDEDQWSGEKQQEKSKTISSKQVEPKNDKMDITIRMWAKGA
ncbi:anti-sigma factor domain-containing protein [Paenibacillus nasutitermitis]|uniref:RsgI N-terminal anti-sigma domain-containing protein n=1 Tax=Paenibacillus nasutitermitis TaxID=1652958 RepID=A0A916YJ73_9BACL|nr:anti-sigma factor domain-containing protein [Paenibacillus nasutitermitis]GGD48324.1 hypothetical protein GCM10010911_02250 [Paenibacillus nasutitermitis]